MAHAIYFQSAAGPSGGLLAGFEIGAPTFWEMCGAAPGVVMNFFWASKSSDSALQAGRLQVELSESMGLNLSENVWSRIGDPNEDFWPAQDQSVLRFCQSILGGSTRRSIWSIRFRNELPKLFGKHVEPHWGSL